MLPLHGHPILRAMARMAMPWRVEISNNSDGSLGTNVPASIQPEDKLTLHESQIGIPQQSQIVNVYLPPELPNDGGAMPVREIARVRVTGGPTDAFTGQVLGVVASAASDDGVTVWLKCQIVGWQAQ